MSSGAAWSGAPFMAVGLARLPLGPVYAFVPLAGFQALWSRMRVGATAAVSRKVFGAGVDPGR